MKMHYTVIRDDEQIKVTVERDQKDGYTITMDGETIIVDAQELCPGEYHLIHGDRSINLLVEGESPEMMVHLDGTKAPVTLLDERQAARMEAGNAGPSRGADGRLVVEAPMPGKVVKSLVKEGQEIRAGQGVIVVEAMKMENELRSPVDGTVKEVLVKEGQNVDAGEDLVVIE